MRKFYTKIGSYANLQIKLTKTKIYFNQSIIESSTGFFELFLMKKIYLNIFQIIKMDFVTSSAKIKSIKNGNKGKNQK